MYTKKPDSGTRLTSPFGSCKEETRMEFSHEPVLLQEVLEWMDVKENGVYADGTLGGGGHSGGITRDGHDPHEQGHGQG